MKLFYKPGACSMAAHILLNETGTSFQLEKVDTGAGITETGAQYSLTNPRGYVPALQLQTGEVLTENVAILSWLAERNPDLAGPEDGGLARFRQLEILSFLTAELHKAFGPYFSGVDASEAEKADNLRKLKTRISQFDALLAKGGDYLLGSAFTVADAYAFVILNWTGFIGVSLADWPRTEVYVARIRARPSAQKALAAEGLAA
ncbi:glutathione binding-like protein [Roseibium salinum]|uniref:Glutathione binding-like protein n=1 Tax=Roseibium salinum TaxID=1604349 RepID=A0ABT3R3S7_9HYPH|nr:glutathione binding-like protein [Roseibium sp. DSM 29163]MCX2723796.1 glutathione binding-like protein [Roseibium sp. DSM 29163]